MMRYLLAGGALLALATPAYAQSDAAKTFGARELIRQVSLLPDARYLVAVVAVPGRGTRAVVIAVDGLVPLKPIFAANGIDEQLDYCEWATDTQLICGLSFIRDKLISSHRTKSSGSTGS